MTDKPNQLPKAAAVIANRAVLIKRLRRVLLSPHDDVIELQSQYEVALGSVAKFLAAEGEKDLALKFIGLACAIGQLKNGTVADVVRPTPGGGRGPDGKALWELRHHVVIVLECMISGKMKMIEAANYIADKHSVVFDRLKRNPQASLAKSILAWRRRINDGDAPGAEEFRARQRSFFEQYGGRSPADMFALGERYLAQIEHTTKVVF